MILVLCVDDLSIGVAAFKCIYGVTGWDNIQTRSSASTSASSSGSSSSSSSSASSSSSSSSNVPIMWNGKDCLGKFSTLGQAVPAMLGATEVLFITAHGNRSEIGNVGDTDKEYNISASNLANQLSSLVLPSGYSGDIYLSACNSWSFGKTFREQLTRLRPSYSGKIFGYKGSPPRDINVLATSLYIEVKSEESKGA